jgi:hypothetical protein
VLQEHVRAGNTVALFRLSDGRLGAIENRCAHRQLKLSVGQVQGCTHLQAGNVKQAEQYFNEALILDEFEPTALYHLAILRYIGGIHDRAARYYDRLCRVEGQEVRAQDLGGKLGFLASNSSGLAGR